MFGIVKSKSVALYRFLQQLVLKIASLSEQTRFVTRSNLTKLNLVRRNLTQPYLTQLNLIKTNLTKLYLTQPNLTQT